MAARVLEIWRYPVKSMQGERLAEGRLTELGLEADRHWALRDRRTGKLVSAKQDRNILFASSRLAGEEVEITMPDGRILTAATPGVDAELSAWLGRDVTLEVAEPTTSGVYDLALDPVDEASETVEYPTPDGSFLDAGAVHLLSNSSLRTMATTAPTSNWDKRRFRPTLLIEVDGEAPYPEDEWVGSAVRVGETTLTVLMPTIRCGMPGRGQPGLEAEPDVVRVTKQAHNSLLGVYAMVDVEGVVREGDEIQLQPVG